MTATADAAADEPRTTPTDKFLHWAQHLFADDAHPAEYVHVPGLVSQMRLWSRADRTPGGAPPLVDPLVYLTGVWYPDLFHYAPGEPRKTRDVEPAERRSISLVVGEYGTGKSELLRELSRYLNLARERYDSNLPEPLPADLSLCRDRAVLDHPLTADEFWTLVFGGLCRKAGVSAADQPGVRDEVRGRLRQGRVMLILDALDELVLDPNRAADQHKHFFAGLTAFVGNVPTEPVRVVLSMRMEYLLAVTLQYPTQFTFDSWHTLHALVNFVELGFFTDESVRRLMSMRVTPPLGVGQAGPPDQALFAGVRDRPRLMDVLRRPLYLKLFLDLYNNRVDDRAELMKIRHAAELFEAFVASAAKAPQKLPAAAPAGPDPLRYATWQVRKLAVVALKYYQKADDRIPFEELMSCLELGQERDPPPPTSTTDDEVRRYYVHKCPFLQRLPRGEMRFAHRAFFEYFTAQGIALAFVAGDQPRPFEVLVANVDMRRFLAYFVLQLSREKGETHWKDEDTCYAVKTREGNAMAGERLNEWRPPLAEGSERWEELEGHRATLLRSMMRPEPPPDWTDKSIRWFLGEDHDRMHPRYLAYNLEAVAVNVRHQWRDDRYQESAGRLEKVVRRILDQYLARLREGGDEGEYLLLHRAADIAHRLRYHWFPALAPALRLVADRCPVAELQPRLVQTADQAAPATPHGAAG